MSQKLKDHFESLRAGNPPLEDAGLFGVNIEAKDAQLVVIPVPFEATTSYGGGASAAPEAILKASHQLDLFDRRFGNPYLSGICYLDDGQGVLTLNKKAKPTAQKVISDWESKGQPSAEDLRAVNDLSAQVNNIVYEKAKSLLAQGQSVGLVGGDHACPLGLIKALGEVHADFGILHIDAHHDLRIAYEGFQYSHASIMHNVLTEVSQVSKILSLGIRDFSEDEARYAADSDRVETLYDSEIHDARMSGVPVVDLLKKSLSKLPKNIYISFDIDGLEPSCCPNTGTPVPGGLDYGAAVFLLELLDSLEHRIIGFDLCEVSPSEDEWDANVGARILYKLCGLMTKTLDLKPLF